MANSGVGNIGLDQNLVIEMECDNNISDRLLQYIQRLGVDLDSFAYNCGVSKQTLLNLKAGYSSTFSKITKSYPQLNIKWLIHGYDKTKEIVNHKDIRDRLLVLCEHLDMDVKEFAKKCDLKESTIYNIDHSYNRTFGKIFTAFPTLSPLWLLCGIGSIEISDSIYVTDDIPSITKSLKEEIARQKELLEQKDEHINAIKNLILQIADILISDSPVRQLLSEYLIQELKLRDCQSQNVLER